MKTQYSIKRFLSSFLIVTAALFLFNSSAFAQEGCININACNYDDTAVFDDGSCIYSGYFIPGPGTFGPAIRACSAPEGYIFPDQICALNVIIADDYCLITSWDIVCQDAYEECMGCDPTIFIPAAGFVGSAKIECELPFGYIYAEQDCAMSVIANDPSCLTLWWDAECQDAYEACSGGCSPVAFIPSLPTTGPTVFGCFAPAGYVPAQQIAIGWTLLAIPSCLENWGSSCQSYYDDIQTLCWPKVQVPVAPATGPAVFTCNKVPDLYEVLDNLSCAEEVITNDAYCLTGEWDAICAETYNECAYGCPDAACTDPSACNYDPESTCGILYLCEFESWYLPNQGISGPPIFGCVRPSNYHSASNICVEAVIANDPYCIDTDWDFICEGQYQACISGNYTAGCTYSSATNFDSEALFDDGTCLFNTSDCPGDLNGDLVINTGDLTGILALFGSSCP